MDKNKIEIDNIFTKSYGISIDLIEKLNSIDTTSEEEKKCFAEHSTPTELLINISKKVNKDCFTKKYKFLDYSCGKGNIILIIFYNYYINLKDKIKDNIELCETICNNIYYSDINHDNVNITSYKINKLCQLICDDSDIIFNKNSYIGNSLNMNISDIWNIYNFDIIFVNPPFEDRIKRNKTPHKLWIDFTLKTFECWLKPGGYLYQISPASFSSPSSKILKLLKEKNVICLNFNQEKYFKNVSISIAWYIIHNSPVKQKTSINDNYYIDIDDKLIYIPNDNNNLSLSIHKKVMFDTKEKLKINKDYVTCHNIKLKEKNSILSKTKTDIHIHPLFHTNKQIWYSSIKQEFKDKKKVMWTRSGYTKPFYDNGIYGYTDLVYFVLVDTDLQGEILNHNLNLKLFRYIFKTARWSGFGNDKVFYALPKLPGKKMNDTELYNHFKLSNEEINLIINDS